MYPLIINTLRRGWMPMLWKLKKGKNIIVYKVFKSNTVCNSKKCKNQIFQSTVFFFVFFNALQLMMMSFKCILWPRPSDRWIYYTPRFTAGDGVGTHQCLLLYMKKKKKKWDGRRWQSQESHFNPFICRWHPGKLPDEESVRLEGDPTAQQPMEAFSTKSRDQIHFTDKAPKLQRPSN